MLKFPLRAGKQGASMSWGFWRLELLPVFDKVGNPPQVVSFSNLC